MYNIRDEKNLIVRCFKDNSDINFFFFITLLLMQIIKLSDAPKNISSKSDILSLK